MRITCFVLGTLCLLTAGIWVVIGILDFSGGSATTSTPTVSGLRATQAAAPSPNIDDFGPASTFAQIFALVGIAWMVGAAAFAPRQAAPAPAAAPAEPQQWQQNPQQH